MPPRSDKASRVLACVLCQHRKIKCDRTMPCSNCVKANATCVPSKPAPIRKRRRLNQDVHDRLAHVEQLLKQCADAPTPSTASPAANEPFTGASIPLPADFGSQIKPKAPGRMVKDESGTRFVGNNLLARVHEELQTMRALVETDDVSEGEVGDSQASTPNYNTCEVFLSGGASTGSLQHLQPEPAHTFRLWQLFLDRVNPLGKLIHVPSLQPYVMEAGANIGNVPLNYQALLFSIFNVATLAMSEAECMQMLGSPREYNIKRFAMGTTAALGKVDFLRNYDMVTLQALLLYQLTLQRDHDRHVSWIISGMVLRIAQKMGYHRDGDSLGLTPFETEMRRRIWWHMVITDSQNSMVSGLDHWMVHTHWDTKMPQNVNDADLFPESKDPIRPREGPTEMALCHISYQIASFLVRAQALHGTPDLESAIMGDNMIGERDASSEMQTERYREQLNELESRLIEVENRFLDKNAGNTHVAALSIRPMLTSKMKQMLVPMREQPEWGTEIFDTNDNLFKVLIMNVEHSTEFYEAMDQTGFLWFFKFHFQLDVFTAMIGKLYQRPTGVLADRAWRLMETIYRFHPELSDLTLKTHVELAHFVMRAWRAREQAFLSEGRPLWCPEFIQRLQQLLYKDSVDPVPLQQYSAAQQPMPAPQFTPMDGFMGNYLDLPTWNWNIL